MKIDFYVLETTSHLQAQQFACRLLEKLMVEQRQIYVNMNTREEAERFDGLLWTFKEDSFLPHQLYVPEQQAQPGVIHIGFGNSTPSPQHILLNLGDAAPSFYQAYEHLIEIVFTDPTMQQLARERYKQYRQHHHINTIKQTSLL